MPTRVEFVPRKRLQEVGHVDQGTPGLWLNKGPSLCLRMLHHDAPLVAEEYRQGATVCVRGISHVGTLSFRRRVDEIKGCIARPVITMAVLEAAGIV